MLVKGLAHVPAHRTKACEGKSMVDCCRCGEMLDECPDCGADVSPPLEPQTPAEEMACKIFLLAVAGIIIWGIMCAVRASKARTIRARATAAESELITWSQVNEEAHAQHPEAQCELKRMRVMHKKTFPREARGPYASIFEAIGWREIHVDWHADHSGAECELKQVRVMQRKKWAEEDEMRRRR